MLPIDLRSDTVTHPSPEMRVAMGRAEVGDDVFGEDPTINRLQDMAADLLNKEAALFVTSGTMGNLISILTHCARGNEIILGDRSHIVLHEQGGAAALGGVLCRMIRNERDGSLDLNELRNVINTDDDVHLTRTKLICLENSWNGRVLRAPYTSAVKKLAREHGLKTHLDGARFFNAVTALKVPACKIAEDFDTLQFCFSKGLAAPVGSLVLGSREFIQEARRNRKLVGGGMRQAGILAAACIVALETMIDRLQEDHDNALLLAEAIANCPGLEIDMQSVETNIVIFSINDSFNMTTKRFCELAKEQGLLMLPLDKRSIRAVTHYGIERSHIEKAKAIINTLSKAPQSKASASRIT